MSDNIRKLVTRPEAQQAEIQAETIDILTEALETAKAGKLTEVCLLARHADGRFTEYMSPTNMIVDWVGRLEVVKHGIITRSIHHEDLD